MTSIKAFATGVAFLGRRLAQALLVMLAVLVIGFAVRSSLGGSLREMVVEAGPEAEREQIRHELGLDARWPVQLARYIGGALHGEPGTSTIYKKPALQVGLRQVP